MRKLLAAFFMCLAASSNAIATDICEDATEQFSEATKIYIAKGAGAFWERVLKNGPLEGDKRSLSQVQGLSQIEGFFGQIQSSSVISKKQLGTRVCYLVAVLEYANGPAFAVATYYRGKKGVGATSMFFKTEPETVLPNKLLVE